MTIATATWAALTGPTLLGGAARLARPLLRVARLAGPASLWTLAHGGALAWEAFGNSSGSTSPRAAEVQARGQGVGSNKDWQNPTQRNLQRKGADLKEKGLQRKRNQMTQISQAIAL